MSGDQTGDARRVSTSETINRLKQTHGLSRRDTLSLSPILSLSSPLDRKRGELFWDKLSIDLAENLNIL